jgi:hypothetical protein
MAAVRGVTFLFGAVLLLAPHRAQADDVKAECVQANTKGQEQRRDGKLSLARESFRACAASSCPSLLRDDCTRRLDEVERVQPTIVFDVKDASGRDVIAVKVTVDGKPLADRLTGAPLQVDPGEHVFAFEAVGQPPVTQTFLIKESEKDRQERIVMGAGSAAGSPSSEASGESRSNAGLASNPPESGGGMGTMKLLGLASAGVGVAGLAVGSVFGLMTSSEANQQKTDCSAGVGKCPNYSAAQSDHSKAITYGAVSTAAFIAGGALVALGGVLFFTGGHAEPAATTALVVVPSVGPGGGGVSLKGEF